MDDVIKKLEQEIREENYRINNENYSNKTRMKAESYLEGMISVIELMGYEVINDRIVERCIDHYEVLDMMR